MKTKKHTISFTAVDTDMSREITISGTEYKRQLEFLTQQVKDTADYEYPMEHRSYVSDFTSHTVTRHYFTIGIADTCLTVYECKPGYKFAK